LPLSPLPVPDPLPPCIELHGVGLTYPGVLTVRRGGAAADGLEALRDVSFGLCPQEFVCLLGPSGSGKSTLLRVLAGLLRPTSGQVIFKTGAEPQDGAPLISVVFQDANLMPWKTVLENVTLPLELRGVPLAEARERAHEWIAQVGLSGFERAWPRELSGGMAQRVAIARALIQEPELLLLDEPFGALDALTREKMAAELLRLWNPAQGPRSTTVLMVTHSISEALLLSDRVLVFSSRPGHVVLDLPVPLPRPRDENMRYTAEFGELALTLRRAIA
jgi:NitT/TauT family transport system ATP-binding protein